MAEAKGSHDVEEAQRNPGLLDPPCGGNSLEEVQSVRGTCLEEISWSCKHGGESGIVFKRGLEATDHHRKVGNSVGASQSSSQRRFERTMKMFNHSIALRMETGGLDPRDTDNGPDL